MRHYATLFFVATVLAVATAEQDEIPRIASPMTHLLVQDELHTTMRPGHYTPKPFKGRIRGKLITDFANVNYKGTLSGTKLGKKVKSDFNYRVSGNAQMPEFNFKFTGGIYGDLVAHGKNVNVRGKFDSRMTGTMFGLKADGRVYGRFRFYLIGKYYKMLERGSFDFTVGGKPMVGKYKAMADSNVFKMDMRGLYRGKPFFVRYALSMNALELSLQGKNPFIPRRNYGTLYIDAGGQTIVEKYDFAGWEFPPIK